MPSKTIKLKAPVTWFDKVVTEIELKEPSAWDLFELGDLTTYSRDLNGFTYVVSNDATIVKYLDKCLKVENGSAILAILPLEDGIAIRETLMGFFAAATSARAA
jgi:hypothetical protein